MAISLIKKVNVRNVLIIVKLVKIKLNVKHVMNHIIWINIIHVVVIP
jgi:hypothetical protein